MRRIRVIPTLLIDSNCGLVKTIRFGKRTYIGDPINAIKIFNDKGVDELLLLDIDASRNAREPNYQVIEDMVSEAFMPVGFGGGVHNVDQMARLFRCGLEKVVLSTAAHASSELVRDASARFGSQSIVVCMDIKRTMFRGYQVRTHSGQRSTRQEPIAYARQLEAAGVGEIIVNSIDRDGTYLGYDLNLISSVSQAVQVPVIALGGARNTSDFVGAIQKGHASAVAAGSMFVYQSASRGVLISYPSEKELNQLYNEMAVQ
jgi:cyclase